jgi:hypothetical protein
MLHCLTRVLALGFQVAAVVVLLSSGNRATRSARRFLAVGFAGWGVFFALALASASPDIMGGLSRGLAVWVAIGVILLVRQLRLIGGRHGRV